jgi:hypothetical protein
LAGFGGFWRVGAGFKKNPPKSAKIRVSLQ